MKSYGYVQEVSNLSGQGIQTNGGVAASERAKANGLAVDGTAQQLLVHLGYQIKPGSRMGVQTLTQKSLTYWAGKIKQMGKRCRT